MDDLYGFERRSVVVALSDLEAGPPAAPSEFTPAREKYEIEGRIGGGGMGEVMLVSDRDLMRQVARL